MRSANEVLVIVAGLLAWTSSTGCSGGAGDCLINDPDCSSSGASSSSSGGGSCGNTGKGIFESTVRPIIEANCANCHSAEFMNNGPNFLGASAAEFYDKLTAKALYVGSAPAASLFLNKGEHTGPAWSAGESAIVSKWLAIEANERFGSCTGKPPPNCKSPDVLLAEFGKCMTLDDWKASNMHQIATHKSDAGPCYACHAIGNGGNIMTNPISDPDIELGFEQMRTAPPMLNLVTWPANSSGSECPDTIEQSYRWRDKGNDGGTHPKYLLLSEHTEALDQWFNMTSTKWKNGPCP